MYIDAASVNILAGMFVRLSHVYERFFLYPSGWCWWPLQDTNETLDEHCQVSRLLWLVQKRVCCFAALLVECEFFDILTFKLD